MEKLQPIREDIIINTKVGRYESDPSKQFDFSRSTTLASVQRSLRRLNCSYIDVLQLHDPEFAPSLDQLMNETIPAMIECRKNGWCRALGMTGYPLEVQFQIFQRTKEDFGEIHVWDQALTYGHFNLHDSSLLNKPICSYQSFAEYCRLFEIGLMAAAPLSMGLLTNGNPPEWHPANAELTEACRKAAVICEDLNVDIAVIASVFALSNPRIPCTIIGCRDVTEVEHAAAMANRFKKVDSTLPQEEILKIVFTENELKAFRILSHPKSGPFSKVWSNGNFQWDGVQSARDFWRDGNGIDAKEWQIRPID